MKNGRRVRKAKDIHISENKANLVNKQKDVKSNFKALELQEKQIGRVRIIEFFFKSKDE